MCCLHTDLLYILNMLLWKLHSYWMHYSKSHNQQIANNTEVKQSINQLNRVTMLGMQNAASLHYGDIFQGTSFSKQGHTESYLLFGLCFSCKTVSKLMGKVFYFSMQVLLLQLWKNILVCIWKKKRNYTLGNPDKLGRVVLEPVRVLWVVPWVEGWSWQEAGLGWQGRCWLPEGWSWVVAALLEAGL